MSMSGAWILLKNTGASWSEDKVPKLAAALAYYTAFSLAPLLVITVAVVGFVFGEDAAQGQIVHQMEGLFGRQGAETAQTMILNAHRSGAGVLATVISAAVLFLGAGGVFAELQDSLNTIWEVKPRPGRGILGMLRDRFLSFAMVLVIAFLLLVSLAVSTVLSAMTNRVSQVLPLGDSLSVAIDLLISVGVITLLIALIYKVLPDVYVGWRYVWIGAFLTAMLFTLGKFGLGLYLSRSTATSVFGAAGSLAAFLLWVYYSAQIVFFGAEFTHVYARSRGVRWIPKPQAVPVSDEMRAQQGIPRRSDIEAAHEWTQPGASLACPLPAAHASSPGRSRAWIPLLVGLLAGLLLPLKRKFRYS
jgi:membrane protein